MPYLPWIPAARADLSPEERSFEALLSGASRPDEPPSQEPPPDEPSADTRLLTDLMSALTAPPAADELDGFAGAQAAYLTQLRPGLHGRPRRWMFPMLGHLPSPKIAAALATGVLGLGGLGAAAYAGALPDTVQDLAHHVLGAPATHPGKGADHPGKPSTHPGESTDHAPGQAGAPTSTPAGPDATGPAAFGLCTAYGRAGGHAAAGSVAFANLAMAAGGADTIEAYCATVPHPGSSASSPAQPSAVPSRAAGAPSTLPAYPTGRPSTLPAHPTGPPSSLPSHPTGPPSSLPSHPTGQPSAPPSHPTGQPSTLPPHPSTAPPHPTRS